MQSFCFVVRVSTWIEFPSLLGCYKKVNQVLYGLKLNFLVVFLSYFAMRL